MATVLVAVLGTLLHASIAVGQSRPLRFGIYSTAAVGTVNAFGATRAEDQTRRWQALDELRGSRAHPFVTRLYTSWDGRTPNDEVLSWVSGDVAAAAARGYQAEIVLRYRPAAGIATSNAIDSYVAFVRQAVRHFASQRRVVALQITNEANVPGQPDASDGAYPGVEAALVRGVRAASGESTRVGRNDLEIGFNVAANAPLRFWKGLRKIGGRRFGRAVDFVGVDLYPQTWTETDKQGPKAAARSMRRELRRLRLRALPTAGVRRGARLHVGENGFPTGQGRNEAEQADLLRAAVRSVSRVSRRYGVSDYRWFSLRDANSSAPSFEAQYGLLRDDYSRKAAFGTYQRLISRLSQ